MFWGKRFRLVSALTPQELAERLKGAVDSQWNIVGGRKFVGRADATSFKLFMRRGGQNAFKTVLYGTFAARDGGTVISGSSGVSHGAWLTGAFFAYFYFLMLGPIWVGYKASSLSLAEKWTESAPLAFMVAFTVLTIAMGRFWARGQREALLDFLEEVTGAERSD